MKKIKNYWNPLKEKLPHLLSGIVFLSLFSCIGEPMNKEVSTYYRKKWNSIYFKEDKGGLIFSSGKYKVQKADAKTFIPLSQNIGIDRNSVYFRTSPQPQIDRASFKIDPDGTIRDKDHIYIPSFINDKSALKILYNVDVKSYGTFKGHPTWGYDKNHIYILYSIPIDVDRATFVFLNDKFMKDKEFLYAMPFNDLKRKAIKTDQLSVLSGEYLRDNQVVYFVDMEQGGEINEIPFRNADSIQVLQNSFLIIDNQIYNKGHLFNEGKADAATFTVLNEYYSQDKSHIFCNGIRMEDTDRNTFEVLPNGMAKDKNTAYYWGKPLKDVDVKTFKSINSYYFSDQNHVYFLKESPEKENFFFIVEGADPAKFFCSKQKGDFWGFEGRKEFYYGIRQ